MTFAEDSNLIKIIRSSKRMLKPQDIMSLWADCRRKVNLNLVCRCKTWNNGRCTLERFFILHSDFLSLVCSEIQLSNS